MGKTNVFIIRNVFKMRKNIQNRRSHVLKLSVEFRKIQTENFILMRSYEQSSIENQKYYEYCSE